MSCDPSPPPDLTQHDHPQPEQNLERSVESSELLRGQREILIRHGDETYRLRLTRNGKLILHK